MTKLDTLLRLATRVGLDRGRRGGRGWMALGMAAGGARIVRRLTGTSRPAVHRERLRPGDTLVITHRDEPRSRGRRR